MIPTVMFSLLVGQNNANPFMTHAKILVVVGALVGTGFSVRNSEPCLGRVYEFAGLEPRIGLLEWTTGMDHWSGLLD